MYRVHGLSMNFWKEKYLRREVRTSNDTKDIVHHYQRRAMHYIVLNHPVYIEREKSSPSSNLSDVYTFIVKCTIFHPLVSGNIKETQGNSRERWRVNDNVEKLPVYEATITDPNKWQNAKRTANGNIGWKIELTTDLCPPFKVSLTLAFRYYIKLILLVLQLDYRRWTCICYCRRF